MSNQEHKVESTKKAISSSVAVNVTNSRDKWTPGPWTTGRAINTVDIGKFSFICPFGANSADQVAEIKANARLIASAPDLLAALEGLRMFPLGEFQQEAARAAIAKARGE